MTVDEIFSKIVGHQIKGLMVHEQLANFYDFLSLHGYKRCHEYHYLCESYCMRKVQRYYINHYNKLVRKEPIDTPKIIPDSWYNYSRMDVDIATRQNALKTGISTWIDWEKETKSLYESMYKELCDIGEIAAACKIKELICDVDSELKYAEREGLKLKAIDYDLDAIYLCQDELHEKYKHKTEKIGVNIC